MWYQAGATTYIHCRAPGPETIEQSECRFRDDEFLLSRDLTKGKSQLRIKVRYVPVDRPLIPGRALGERAWSEISYSAYTYVMPKLGI